MMRGMPPPHMMRDPRFRPPFGPPLRPPMPPRPSSSGPRSAPAPEGEPKPLMSIETPMPVKELVHKQLEKERANQLAQRQKMQHQRVIKSSGLVGGQVAGVKRPAGGLSGPPANKYSNVSSIPSAPMKEPSTIVRSNLRQIQCVDESKSVSHSGGFGIQNRNLRGVPTGSGFKQNTIPTHVGNLRTIPLVNDQGSSLTRGTDDGTRCIISNLPATVTFDKVNQLTVKAGGNVKTINMEGGTRAVVDFNDAGSAARFQKMFNRKMMDLSILNISRV